MDLCVFQYKNKQLQIILHLYFVCKEKQENNGVCPVFTNQKKIKNNINEIFYFCLRRQLPIHIYKSSTRSNMCVSMNFYQINFSLAVKAMGLLYTHAHCPCE